MISCFKVFSENLNYLIFLHTLMFLLNFYHPKLDYFVDRIYAVLFFISLTTLMCIFFSFQIKINWLFISLWFICFYVYVIINHVGFIQFNLHFNSNLSFFLKIIILYLCLKIFFFILKIYMLQKWLNSWEFTFYIYKYAYNELIHVLWITYWSEFIFLQSLIIIFSFKILNTKNVFKKLYYLFLLLMLFNFILITFQKELFACFLLISEMLIIVYFYILMIYINRKDDLTIFKFRFSEYLLTTLSLIVFFQKNFTIVTLKVYLFTFFYKNIYHLINNFVNTDVYILFYFFYSYMPIVLILVSLFLLITTFFVIIFFILIDRFDSVSTNKIKSNFFVKNIFFFKTTVKQFFLKFFK